MADLLFGEARNEITKINVIKITIVEPEGKSNIYEKNKPKTAEKTPKIAESIIIVLILKVHWYAAAAGVTIIAKTKIAPIAFNETEIVKETAIRKR